MQRFLPSKLARAALASLALVGVPFIPSLNAATVVEWGGDYVTGYQAFTAGTPSSGAGWATYHYSNTVYSDASALAISPTGPTFYGALSVVNGSGTGTADFAKTDSRFGIQNGSPDSIRFGVKTSADSGTVTMRGLAFFKKEDFLNGGSNGTVNFSEGGSLSLNVSSLLGEATQVRLAVYALVGETWGWYLSEGNRTSSGTLTVSNAGLANWAPYVVTTTPSSLGLNAAPTTYNVSGASFTEIGAFGFYFTGRSAATLNNTATMFATSYQVNATVIPEPGVAMLSIGGLGLLTARRFLGSSFRITP